MARFFDFLIHIGERRESGDDHDHAGEGHGGYYPVEARLEDGAVFDGGELALDRVGVNLAALHQDAEAHGRKLSEAIFSGAIDQAFQRALGGVQRGSGYDGVRVRISIAAEAPELHSLGWERLYYQDEREWGPLATSASSPFSRYVTLRHPHPLPAVTGPVRILVVIAHPSGVPPDVLAPIDVAAEIENFHSALAELPGGAVQVTFMPGRSGLPADQRRILEQAGHIIVDGPTSLDRIAARLRGGHDVLHFLGHGHFDQATSTATLHLEDAKGGWDTVADTKFTNMMRSLRRRPRLVFLAACQSATRAEHDAFIGLAPKLVRAHVPAVVAMQDEVSMADARTLTRHFYANLFEHGIVDLALNQARSQLYQPDRLDWGIPVLFTRLTDGRLFAPADERSMSARSLLDFLPHRVTGWLLRGLVMALPILLLSYWLGSRAQQGRELLLGIPVGKVFSYSVGDLLVTGLRALPRLAGYMLTAPFVGLGIERWAVPILVTIAGAAWWLHRRGHVRVLVVGLALLLPVLAAGVVCHAHAARVHHLVIGNSNCSDPIQTVPEQIRFEVCSWLRNPTEVNRSRRQALAGLGCWFAVALGMLAWLGVSVARRTRHRRGRRLVLGLAAMHGLLFVYVLMLVPRVYAIVHWGLAYPKITAIHAGCASAALRDAIASDTCQAVDVTEEADQEAWILWGSACSEARTAPASPGSGAGTDGALLMRVPPPTDSPAGSRCALQTSGVQTTWKRSDSI